MGDKNILPFCELVFQRLAVSLAIETLFNFSKSHLSIIGLNSWETRVLFRNSFLTVLSCWVLPMFSSMVSLFKVSCLGL